MPQPSQPFASPSPQKAGPFGSGDLVDLTSEIDSPGSVSVKEEGGRKTKMLVRYPEFRVALIAMKAGSRWDDHKTSARILVQLLRGRIRFHTPEGAFDIGPGQLLTLNPGILHSVDSPEESAFLLTLSDARKPVDPGSGG